MKHTLFYIQNVYQVQTALTFASNSNKLQILNQPASVYKREP